MIWISPFFYFFFSRKPTLCLQKRSLYFLSSLFLLHPPHVLAPWRDFSWNSHVIMAKSFSEGPGEALLGRHWKIPHVYLLIKERNVHLQEIRSDHALLKMSSKVDHVNHDLKKPFLYSVWVWKEYEGKSDWTVCYNLQDQDKRFLSFCIGLNGKQCRKLKKCNRGAKLARRNIATSQKRRVWPVYLLSLNLGRLAGRKLYFFL